MKKTMKNTMKNTIAVFIFSMLVCTVAAFAWPWGNVGLNVDAPEAQLDVGGDVLVRSNLTAYGELTAYGSSPVSGGFRHIPGEGIYANFGYGYPNNRQRATISFFHPDGSGQFHVGTNYIIIGNDNSSEPALRITPILSPVTGVVYRLTGGSPPKAYTWTNVYSP